MAFYAAVPLGFALASPANAVWAALLLASFVCTAASFLGRAVMAVERGEADDGARGRKSFFYAAGIIEGTETILAFVLFCLFPDGLPLAGRAVRRAVLLDGGGPRSRSLAGGARRRALARYCMSR